MRLSVVIPAYNEEDNIEPIIKEALMFLSGLNIDFEIIVVDDGSTDNTVLKLQNLRERDGRINLFKHSLNQGLGAALLTGFKAAKGELVAWIPADGQIHPVELNKLLNAMDSCDFAVAKYIKRPDSLVRRLNSAIWHFLIRLILQYRVDFDGNYMFKRGLLNNFSLRSNTGLVNFEFVYKAKAKGYAVNSILISCELRAKGKSKVFNFKTIWKTFWEMAMLRFFA